MPCKKKKETQLAIKSYALTMYQTKQDYAEIDQHHQIICRKQIRYSKFMLTHWHQQFLLRSSSSW